MEEASALSHARDTVDIYSNSWGPSDTGSVVFGPRTLTRLTLENGINKVSILCFKIILHQSVKGRGGKGSIYVWSNGNGGDYDHCAADGYVSSIYTISVGTIRVDGHYSYSDERCSAKTVVAYVTDVTGNAATVCVVFKMWLYKNFSNK